MTEARRGSIGPQVGAALTDAAAKAAAGAALLGVSEPRQTVTAAAAWATEAKAKGGSTSDGTSRRHGRKSVVLQSPAGSGADGGGSSPAARRGSVLAGSAATASRDMGNNDGDAGALHPALDRIRSFHRKKSAFRSGPGASGGAGKARFDDLAAAMDTVDDCIGGALRQLRSQNAAGLGAVRGLVRTKTGRLLLGSRSGGDAPTPQPASTGGDVQQQHEGECSGDNAEREAYTPIKLLGARAAEHPDSFLPRMKFEVKVLQTNLHAGGVYTARGRLQGNADAAAQLAEAELIPAVHATGQASTAQPAAQGALEVQQGASSTLDALPSTQQQQQRRGTLGARWGAPLGSMDKLAWVRNLVQFGEYKQRQQLLVQEPAVEPAASGGDAAAAQPGLDTIGWLDSGAGLRRPSPSVPGKAGGPASPPGTAAVAQAVRGPPVRSRDEVTLLQSWLQEMMAQVVAQAGQPLPVGTSEQATEGGNAEGGGKPASDPAGSAATLADAALWVYGMAFEEVQRQVGTECGERGALLGGMWQHVFNLVELRCSLVYESIIAAIKEELQAARRRAASAAADACAAEERVRESMYYSRDKFSAMEAEVKRLAQLLAAGEEEVARYADEAALLRRAVDTQGSLRAAAEGRAAEEHRQRVDLQHQVEELQEAATEQAAAAAARDTELAQLGGDLQRTRAESRTLAEDKARLEVEVQQVRRDFQTAEIMALSLRERLAAREAELSDLTSNRTQLQQEHARATLQLAESQASLTGLQVKHEILQASSAQQTAALEAALAGERATLSDVRRELGETQAERTALQRSLEEAGARETALTAQLKQLAGAHEQQTAKLRQETDSRRSAGDELQALRAGLQVTQQRLEGLGIVFASATAHRTSAEAWRVIGPISMGRQVVAAVNQQLGELATRKAELQHELGVAQERWQTEEGVRVRLQEQLLETKARESKLAREREGLDGVLARLEARQSGQDAELGQMRRMLADAESRCQASHKKAMEASNEAKRLAPLEPQLARLSDGLHASHAELERVQREVTAHQSSIRKLLDEKSTALEQLAARNQALDAAQLQIRELSAASRDRMALADDKAKLEEQLHELRQRCSATERLQSESMHQLTVARRLLADAHDADERARLEAAHAELVSSKAAAAATRRESILLRDRLTATEGQLQFMERQLHVAVHAPLAAAVAAAAGLGGGAGGSAHFGGGGGASSAVVDQLRRLLDTKEERIRQLERLHGSMASATAQLKHAEGELTQRDTQIALLQGEMDTTRKRLHALQEAQAKAATKDLVALAASDPALPPEIAQSLALDYARNHLRSELAWKKAKLLVVCHMASGLRAKLQASEAALAQAELESVCVEAFYLEQALLEQRAFAAAFDATFVQVKRIITSTLASLGDLRRQLVGPAAADLPRIAAQAGALTVALTTWVERFQEHKDQSCQADPLTELSGWQAAILGGLLAVRPASPPPLHHVSSIIVQLYSHRLRQLPLAGPPETSSMLDNVFEAMAEFFCERRSFSREAALAATGPVMALLAGVRSHLQQPKQLLLGRLVGLVPSGGSGSSRSLQHPAAWQFFVRLLCCLRVLHGAGWDALVKEWSGSEEGVPLPLPCVMDVLANLYNTDAPALLDSMRRGLVPLVRQGRRGPAVDLDAFLLVCMEEYSDGACPISPLSLPRRLTDGALASGALPSSGAVSGSSGMNSTVQGVAAMVGGPWEAYQLAAGLVGDQQHRQRSPMRKRIVNLTAAAEALPLVGPPRSPPLARSGAASPEPSGHQCGSSGPASGNSGPLVSRAVGAAGSGHASVAAGIGAVAGGTRSMQVLSGMASLMASNPALPVGLRSSLRSSSPSSSLNPGGADTK